MRDTGPSLRSPPRSAQRRTSLATIALVAVLALAGCTGALTGDGGDTLAGEEPQIAAENVTADAIAAIEAVEAYRLESNSTIVQTVNNVERERQIQSETRIDRADREVHASTTVSARGQTLAIDVYLVNETMYERNQRYVRQFSSEWVRYDVADNISDVWLQYDTLRIHRNLLDNGTTTLNGTDEVDGEDVYVLALEANESGLESFTVPFQGEVTIDGAEVTYLVDQETGMVRRASGTIAQSVDTGQQTVETETTFDIDFGYDESVTVSLPDAAEGAVDLREELDVE
jgi:hypothetical protein